MKKKNKNKNLWGKENKELWDFDYTIAKFILPRLKTFRKVTDTYPGEFKNLKQWKRTLKKIIAGFEAVVLPYKKNDTLVDFSKRQKTIKRGLKLFSKHFGDLWL